MKKKLAVLITLTIGYFLSYWLFGFERGYDGSQIVLLHSYPDKEERVIYTLSYLKEKKETNIFETSDFLLDYLDYNSHTKQIAFRKKMKATVDYVVFDIKGKSFHTICLNIDADHTILRFGKTDGEFYFLDSNRIYCFDGKNSSLIYKDDKTEILDFIYNWYSESIYILTKSQDNHKTLIQYCLYNKEIDTIVDDIEKFDVSLDNNAGAYYSQGLIYYYNIQDGILNVVAEAENIDKLCKICFSKDADKIYYSGTRDGWILNDYYIWEIDLLKNKKKMIYTSKEELKLDFFIDEN